VAEREPARKQGPARAGTAPRKRESSEGRLQGRERHGTRPRSVGATRRAAGSARGSYVPWPQPEPSRGARTLRTAPARSWHSSHSADASRRGRGERGTRRCGVRGSKKPRRGGSRVPGRFVVASAITKRDGARAAKKRQHSEEEPNSTREPSGTQSPGSRPAGKNPEAASTARGERQEPRKRYPTGRRL